jgi:two-component system, NtrC family, response regulator AtoC
MASDRTRPRDDESAQARSVQAETAREIALPPLEGTRLSLMVIGDNAVAAHLLPAAGEVTIGRGHDVDVQIDHPSISRRHALLRIGATTTIEDLGSANGTRVRDRWLPPGEQLAVTTDEVIDVGLVLIILQQRAATPRPRRLWTHSHFEARLAEECGRAARKGQPFAVAQIRCDRSAPARKVEECLADVLRSVDVVGYYAPGEYEALFTDTPREEIERLLGELERRLAAVGITARTGVAWHPQDGRDPDSLMAVTSAAARGDKDARAKLREHVILAPGGTMQNLQRLVERIAVSTISVLILGETGVGKEVLAERLHRLSARAARPCLRLNCAALSESLLESELFGHERGAFTGAVREKPGLLETAAGGTVFLDEVGELPMTVQVKLLRVIESLEVLPVGGLKPRPIDVRFVAATNRDLEAEVARGTFRQDLYFRLNGISLVIPPLRERVDEIAGLARTFADAAARQAGRPTLDISDEAMMLLLGYSWPGNIRELKNVIERAVVLCAGREIRPEHLPIEKITGVHTVPMPAAVPAPAAAPASAPAELGDVAAQTDRLHRKLEALERQRIIDALEQAVGNQTEAARLLGIARRTLINKLEQYGIPRPRKRRTPDK